MTKDRFLPPAETTVVIACAHKLNGLRAGKPTARLLSPGRAGFVLHQVADQPAPEGGVRNNEGLFRISQAQNGISLNGTTTPAEAS